MSRSNESSADLDSRDSRGRVPSVFWYPSLFAIAILSCHIDACVNSAAIASDAQASLGHLQIGWQDSYLVGRWTQVVIDVDVTVAGEYQVHAIAPDPDGHRVTFSAGAKALVPGRQELHGLFKVGRLNPEIEIQVVAVDSGETVWRWNSSESNSPRLTPVTPETRLVLTTGKPSGFDWENPSISGETKSRSSPNAASDSSAARSLYRTVNIAVEKLPTDAMAYDGVSLLVIAGQSVISQQQSLALRNWVGGGGKLVISLPTDAKEAGEMVQPLSDWLPVTVRAEDVTVRNFGKLEFFAGRNVRIPFTGRMSIPGIKIEQGEYLAGGRDEALLVRSPFGLGSVTVLALDLTEPPLSKWSEVNSLGRRLAESYSDAEISAGRPQKNLQLSSSGVSDFATQLHAVQEDFADVSRASPWFVMGLFSVLLVVIGPLDYVLVHRLLKRPRGTWITFPLWIGLGTVLSANLATSWNGTSQRINQLNVINVDAGSSTCHQKLWTNLYSPETARKSVMIRSALKIEPDSSGQSIHSSWSAVPETSFGGMLRPSGLYVGSADYHQSINGPVEGIPFSQWSSKPLLTEVHSAANKLVESDLQSTSAGRLSGTLIHRLPGPIEDWFLVHGNRVYRQMKQREDRATLPLAANQVWRVEQPNVFQRELRAFLTGEMAMSKTRGSSKQTDVIQRHHDYDPLSRNSAEVFRTLTFYNQAGGRSYTSLTNNVLEAEDLSHLLKLGRAVLFGRLNAPASVIQVDGQTVQPNRESTFVRIILPVKKQGSEMPGALERFEK